MIWRLYAAQRVLAVLCILYVAGPSDSEVELMHARQLFGNTIVIKLPSRYDGVNYEGVRTTYTATLLKRYTEHAEGNSPDFHCLAFRQSHLVVKKTLRFYELRKQLTVAL
ncbi:hypothetical protein AAVH_39579, partial [Aphelenchoides avenae]